MYSSLEKSLRQVFNGSRAWPFLGSGSPVVVDAGELELPQATLVSAFSALCAAVSRPLVSAEGLDMHLHQAVGASPE